MTQFLSRLERFDRVGSTNDVVRDWLAAGVSEVCLAVAREQTAGRGRGDRRWLAPAGAALLVSLGFRPTWLLPDRVWRLAAVASLAMADAAETVAALPAATIRLKWPNDLVIATGGPAQVRKVAGVLGETAGLGTRDPSVVVGIGVNADWPAATFPPDLAGSMTSLREAAGGRAIDLDALLEAFIEHLEPRVESLREGHFDGARWADRQLTTGRTIRLETAGGGQFASGDQTVRALGVDPASGALIVEDASTPTGRRHVHAGEITHVRLADSIAEQV
jgi:BirA family biotin operon repressor/biotin-[acetyl-CoA-carboxylase] ligase